MTIFQDSGKPILVAKPPVVTHGLDSWWEDLTSRLLFPSFETCLHRKSTSLLPSSPRLSPSGIRANGLMTLSLTPLFSLGSRTIHLHHHRQSLGAREAVDGKEERNKSRRLAELAHRPRTETEGINTAFGQRGV